MIECRDKDTLFKMRCLVTKRILCSRTILKCSRPYCFQWFLKLLVISKHNIPTEMLQDEFLLHSHKIDLSEYRFSFMKLLSTKVEDHRVTSILVESLVSEVWLKVSKGDLAR